MKHPGDSPLSKALLPCAFLTMLFTAIETVGEPVPYWDLTPLFEPGQLTLFNETTYDGENGVPVRTVDLNGDGRDEVVVSGIRGDGPDETRESAGEVHITFWDEPEFSGFIDFAHPSPRVLAVYGAAPEEYLGICLAPGDYDDDGFDDLVIGAFGSDAPGRDNAGRVYVLFGDAGMSGGGVIDLADGLPPNVTSVLGSDLDDRLGTWAAAGDIDNDGADDLLLGADRADGPNDSRPQAGKGIILYGPIPRGVEIDLASWPGRTTVIWGVDEEDHLGATVEGGDFDDDGFDDAVFAAASQDMSRNVYDNGGGGDGPPGIWRRDAGETWVVFGRADLPDTVDLAAPGTVATTVIYGRHKAARAGEELGTADVNGDGADDLLIGSLTSNGPPNDYRINAGEGYVFFGDPSFRNQVIDLALDTYPRLTVHGKRGTITTDSFTSGDINNDGFDDLLIGMPCDPGPHDRGAGVIVVVYGSPNLPAIIDLKNPAVPITLLEGVDFDDNTAYWATSGDANGDGFTDVVTNSMTADSYRNSRPVAGEVRVVSGKWLTKHPAPPDSFRVVSNTTEGSVELAWDPSPTSSTTAYLLEWTGVASGSPQFQVLPAGTLSHTVTSLPDRLPCQFRIASLAGLFRSRYSPAVFSTPGSFPTPVGLRTTLFGKSEVRVEWDPIDDPNLLGYLLYRWVDGETLNPENPPFSVFLDEPVYVDDAAPSYTGVHYAVSAFSDTEAGVAREIFQSDISAPVRIFTRPLIAGSGLLLLNDYDWSIHSDGAATNFFGDPWEMYASQAVTGGLAFDFWDFRLALTVTYPPGYTALGNGPVDPDVLFDHGAAMIVAHGPDGGTDLRLKDQAELLLEFRAAGGDLIFMGWLMGSYLTPSLSEVFHIEDWDRPQTVSNTRKLFPDGFAEFDSIGPDSAAGAAVFSDIPELTADSTITVIYRLDAPGTPPMLIELSGPTGQSEGFLLSASPSFLDYDELREATRILLNRLPGLRTAVPQTLPPEPRVGLPYPNPARGGFRLDFRLEESGPVEATVIDVRGRRLKTLLSGICPPETVSIRWNGRDESGREAAAGVYFLSLKSREFTTARRIVLLP